MRSFFRLLPLTIGIAVLLLLVKVVQGFEMGQNVFSSLLVAPVVAQEEAQDKKEEDSEAAKEGEATEGEEGAEEKKKEEADEDDDIMGGFLEVPDRKLTAEDLIGNQLGGLRPDDRRFSPVELELLQQLSKRRKNLDQREEQLLLKENLLTQTEKRVDEKLQEMQGLKLELADVIVQYKEVEETKIKSLVKIYENMKPQDAARIFDELEMPVLILVIDKMKEKKAAPILANMNPKKAKLLTVQLAEKRKMEDAKIRRAKITGQQTP